MSQKVEKVQKGGGKGSALEIKKSTIQNVDFLIRGGSHIYTCFPNVNAHLIYFSWRKNKLVLKWFLGTFQCFKLTFLVLRGGSETSNFFHFQIFPKLGTKGGVVKFQIFPKFKKVQIILGEGRGGVKKIVDFSTIWDILVNLSDKSWLAILVESRTHWGVCIMYVCFRVRPSEGFLQPQTPHQKRTYQMQPFHLKTSQQL